MIEVRVHFSKAARGDPATMRRLARPVAVATAIARRVRERVARRGETATEPDEDTSPTRRGRSFVRNLQYVELKGLDRTHWRSLAQFHVAASVRSNSYDVTGGMWAGLQARNYGGARAIVDFRGSSRGGFPYAGQTAGGKQRKRPPKVRNQAKAWAVWVNRRVNVVQPTDREEAAICAAVAVLMGRKIDELLGGRALAFHLDGDRAMFVESLRELDKRARR